jgi:hypothetical protein
MVLYRNDNSIDLNFDEWVIGTIKMINEERDQKKRKGYGLALMNTCIRNQSNGILPPAEFSTYVINCFSTYMDLLNNGHSDNLKKAFHIDGRVSSFDDGPVFRMITSLYVIGFNECRRHQKDNSKPIELENIKVEFTKNLNSFVQFAQKHGYQVALQKPTTKLNKSRLVDLVMRLLKCKKTKAHYTIDEYGLLDLIENPINIGVNSI